MVIKLWVCFSFLISMSWHKTKVKPLRTADCRASGVSSNLGEVCREVRDQFRGPFIKGMSTGGSVPIGSWVDLESRSESSRMEGAAEISQAVHGWHWMPFWVMVLSPGKGWFPNPPSKGKGEGPSWGGGGAGHVAHAASFTSTRMAEGPDSSQKSCTAAFSLNSCHWLDAKFLFIHSSQFVPANRET